MDKILLCFIFSFLGIALYVNRKKAEKAFEQHCIEAVISGMGKVTQATKITQRVMLILLALIVVYSLISLFVPVGSLPLVAMLAIFLGLYYMQMYQVHRQWYVTETALWSKQLLAPIGFENIVSYECRDYKDILLVRVRYKGKGIMLIQSDFEIKPSELETFCAYLDAHIAGI